MIPAPRYIPFTQQRYCCVPTCLAMIMYRYDIPLIPIESLGYALGLTVPQEDLYLFEKACTGTRPVAGWGTRINEPEFEVNGVLQSLDIPLRVTVESTIGLVEELRSKFQSVQDADGDALVCFDYGALWNLGVRGGHVCVFHGLDGDDVWLIDPERNVPKNRKVSLKQLFKAIDFHGSGNSCGVWSVSATK